MNVEWKPVRMEDRELIENFYEKEQPMSCEFSFANNILWSPYYHTTYSIIRDCLVFRSGGEGFSVSFPIGRGDVKGVVEDFLEHGKEQDIAFAMHLVTQEQFERLEELFPGKFQIEFNRDYADYIYESEKLCTLAGKKLHGKRNHINKFKQNYPEWTFEELTDANVNECVAMAHEWAKRNGVEEDEGKNAEFAVTLRALKEHDSLRLCGGLIRADGEVVAFSLGEPCSRDTFVVHIEKAYADVQGAYPMMNQQFVEHIAREYRYINREEDTGSEGLRKAKLSYYPDILLEKGLVTLK